MFLSRNMLSLFNRTSMPQNLKPLLSTSATQNISNNWYSVLPVKNESLENKPFSIKSRHQQLSHQTVKYQSSEAGDNGSVDISKRISGLVSASDVVVFMKGVPSAPRCGFSNAVCQVFRMHNVDIDSHDILEDEELRQGIKEYSNWPTIPQVYFKGEFIGGCDILLQLHQSGELIEELEKIGIKSALITTEEDKDNK